MKILLTLLILTIFTTAGAIEKFIFIGGDEVESHENKITRDIDGVQIIYNWRQLEPEFDQYDFSKIQHDLKYLESRGKKLWIQIQDRSFWINNKAVPSYIINEKQYQKGVALQVDNPGENIPKGHGWVAKQYNPNVRNRFQKLLQALAEKFDGKVYGMNLPETSMDIDEKAERKYGFTCDKYFTSTIENINFARTVFKKSHVVQYVNFWPCEWNDDKKYMSRFFENAIKSNIGLGGPDVIPYKKAQMKNSYPFFNKYKGKIPFVAFAIQEPTRTYTNPKTGKKFTDYEFQDFAEKYLGVDVLFLS
jgi:hypothetical protein